MKRPNFDRSATPLWDMKNLTRRPAREEMLIASLTTGLLFLLAVAMVLLLGALVSS